MAILVVQAVDNYGSTQHEELVVPLTMVAENHPSPSKNTKKLMCACIIGMTAAALVSSALLCVSMMMDSSVLRASTEESFLLHRKDGTCVVQSGAWTPGTKSVDDDAAFSSGPYATCFISLYDQHPPPYLCWTRSYINKDGDWKPCKPKGYGSGEWTEYGHGEYSDGCGIGDEDKVNCCGPPCTEFE